MKEMRILVVALVALVVFSAVSCSARSTRQPPKSASPVSVEVVSKDPDLQEINSDLEKMKRELAAMPPGKEREEFEKALKRCEEALKTLRSAKDAQRELEETIKATRELVEHSKNVTAP